MLNLGILTVRLIFIYEIVTLFKVALAIRKNKQDYEHLRKSLFGNRRNAIIFLILETLLLLLSSVNWISNFPLKTPTFCLLIVLIIILFKMEISYIILLKREGAIKKNPLEQKFIKKFLLVLFMIQIQLLLLISLQL